MELQVGVLKWKGRRAKGRVHGWVWEGRGAEGRGPWWAWR
jgi:hypothetical protein